MPGNHDERAALREAFPEGTICGRIPIFFISTSISRAAADCPDSLVPKVHGALCAKVHLVRAAAGGTAGQAVVRDPPSAFTTGIARMDDYGMQAGAVSSQKQPALGGTLAVRPSPRSIQARWAGTRHDGPQHRAPDNSICGRGPLTMQMEPPACFAPVDPGRAWSVTCSPSATSRGRCLSAAGIKHRILPWLFE